MSCSPVLVNTLGLTLDLKAFLDFDCWYWECFAFQSFENKTSDFEGEKWITPPILFFILTTIF